MVYNGVLPDRSANATYAFRDVPMPTSFFAAQVASKMFASIALVFSIVFAFIVIRGLRHLRGRQKRFTMYVVLADLIVIAVGLCWNTSMTFSADLGIDRATCSYLGGFGGMFYALTNFFCYIVLLMRAYAVKKTSTSWSPGAQRLHKIAFNVLLVATASSPLIVFSSPVFFKGTLYFQEEVCVQVVTQAVSWAFTGLDTFLSAGYLLLFVIPVVAHVRSIETRARNSVVGRASESGTRTDQGRFNSKREIDGASYTTKNTFNSSAMGDGFNEISSGEDADLGDDDKEITIDGLEALEDVVASTATNDSGGEVQRIDLESNARMQSSGEQVLSRVLRQVAVSNLKISVVAISTSFIYLTGVSITSTLLGSTTDESIVPLLHFQQWEMYGGAIDMMINAICNLLLTKKLWCDEELIAFYTSCCFSVFRNPFGTTKSTRQSSTSRSPEGELLEVQPKCCSRVTF